ncbi:hypothetical protein GCM10027155_01570 [Acinetobacter apis]|uniref:Uncharacterized protein n=1 Tax=Acinetobacter apis TaxID=1229165 RepID=A0A217ECV1_9GAMM|nr:hypothetical protein [Acinetobacter apis]SNQ28244.1 hypothetical protein SAMN05444584_0157 [Acinetobacter apis]
MKLKTPSCIKKRNHVALSPLLHKGGMHETEKPKALNRKDRKQAKLALKHSY